MNKLFLTMVAILSLGFGACNNDDDGLAANAFRFDQVNYRTSQALLRRATVQPNPNLFGFGVNLLSDGFTISNTGAIGGRGNAVSLDLWTTDVNGLRNGTYTFRSSNTASDFGITGGFVLIDFDADNGVATTRESIRSGSILVNRTATTLNVSYELATNTGRSVIGKYSGPYLRS